MSSIFLTVASAANSDTSWLEGMAHFGTFLSGLGAIGLVGLGFYTANSLWLWSQQQRQQRKSDWAFELFKKITNFEKHMKEWVPLISAFFVYSKSSKENLDLLDSLPEDKRKRLLEFMQSDPMELSNFLKRGEELRENLEDIKIDSELLDKDITKLFEPLDDAFDKASLNLRIKHFISGTKDEKIKAENELGSIKIKELRQQIASIREKIIPYAHFEK